MVITHLTLTRHHPTVNWINHTGNRRWKHLVDHSWSGVVYNFGRYCLSAHLSVRR